MGNLTNYIDYERFGHDIRLEECGTFTAQGYARNNGDTLHEEYNGVNMPDEYRVFAMPKPVRAAKSVSKPKVHHDRDERIG